MLIPIVLSSGNAVGQRNEANNMDNVGKDDKKAIDEKA